MSFLKQKLYLNFNFIALTMKILHLKKIKAVDEFSSLNRPPEYRLPLDYDSKLTQKQTVIREQSKYLHACVETFDKFTVYSMGE